MKASLSEKARMMQARRGRVDPLDSGILDARSHCDGIMVGGALGDVISAYGTGHRIIVGGGGDDGLYVFEGSAEVHGGDGADSIFTGAGADVIYPGRGANQVSTAAGNDRVVFVAPCELAAAAGSHLNGGSGTDTLSLPGPASLLTTYGITAVGFESIVDHGESLHHLAQCN